MKGINNQKLLTVKAATRSSKSDNGMKEILLIFSIIIYDNWCTTLSFCA